MQSVAPADVATYLGIDPNTIDAVRAQMFIDMATARASNYVTPLPDAAWSLVVELAAQGFSRPLSVATESIGPYHVAPGASGVVLTKAMIKELRMMAGRGNAFSVDPTPVDAGTGQQPWDTNVTWLDGIPLVDDDRY